MRTPQVFSLVKSFVASAVCRFSWRSSTQESTTYLSSPNPQPAPIIGNDLPHERYHEALRELRPLFPPNCPSFEADRVKVVGDKPIDAGGHADIWKATLTLDGHDVIQKSYRFQEICDTESFFRRYRREVSACSQLSHPNIIPLVGIISTPDHPFSLAFDTAGHLGLREYLNRNPQADKLKLVQGIARGLKHVHHLDIVHGRLCSQNILVGPDGTPRITGFGSSFLISRPDLWSDKDVAAFHRGSAPELMKPGRPQPTKESDIYAFGMLTWEIFSGKDPFPGDPDAAVVIRVLKEDRPLRPDNCAGLSRKTWKMVKACWRDAPSKRMAVGEVIAVLDAE